MLLMTSINRDDTLWNFETAGLIEKSNLRSVSFTETEKALEDYFSSKLSSTNDNSNFRRYHLSVRKVTHRIELDCNISASALVFY